VNQLERYPLKSNSENPRQATPRPAPAELGSLVNCFGGKSRDILTCPHILRVRAETKQSCIGATPQNLFDDRLQSTFVAQVAGAKFP
jgi:hypothetical protein